MHTFLIPLQLSISLLDWLLIGKIKYKYRICFVFREQSKSPRRPVETGKYANVYNELSDVGLPDNATAADIFTEPGKIQLLSSPPPHYVIYTQRLPVYEQCLIPHHSVLTLLSVSDRAVYAHHCCAAWNNGVIQAEDYTLQFVDRAAFGGLSTVSIF